MYNKIDRPIGLPKAVEEISTVIFFESKLLTSSTREYLPLEPPLPTHITNAIYHHSLISYVHWPLLNFMGNAL